MMQVQHKEAFCPLFLAQARQPTTRDCVVAIVRNVLGTRSELTPFVGLKHNLQQLCMASKNHKSKDGQDTSVAVTACNAEH